MLPILDCPSAEELESLASGASVPEVTAGFLEHLHHCSRCGERLENTSPFLTLISEFRRGANVKPEYSFDDLETVRRGLQDQATSIQAAATDATPADVPVKIEAEVDFSTFLEPPYGPGEIGRLGTYSVRKVLGAGGMGIVFEAEDLSLERHVALKVMHPKLAANVRARQRFLREARAAAALDHEHIVPIYQVGEEHGVPYLAMKLLQGTSLSERLKQQPPLRPDEVVRIGREIALGLAAAHERGLIHRDIKPANIMLESRRGPSSADYRVTILDFGLACTQAGAGDITKSGDVMGTPAYMAPEQARGLPLDHRADLFSLGSILYELTTGRRPFPGADALAIAASLASDTPLPPHQVNARVPAPLSDFVMRLLERTPARRPASAREVADQLAQLSGEPAAARSRKSRRLLLVAASLLLVAIGALLVPQVIIIIRDAQGNKVAEVPVEKGGPFVVEFVEKNPPAIPASPAADRRAALWVLSIGGAVRIFEDRSDPNARIEHRSDGQGIPRHITKVADLPRIAFTLVEIHLDYNAKVTDAGLANCAGCKSLRALYLTDTRAGDTGLAHFKDSKEIGILHLARTDVTDAGLAHFKDCNLGGLQLYDTSVGDAGLAHLKKSRNLSGLHMHRTQVGDAGLVHFKNLGLLQVGGSKVTDAGLAVFKGSTTLHFLNVENTAVSDASLAVIASVPNLKGLDLSNTRVSLRGFEQLNTALAKVRDFSWSESNRTLAESVLFLGGAVDISERGRDETRPIKAAADLPRDYFQVRRVSLAGVAKDIGSAIFDNQLPRLRFPEFDRLEVIDLTGISRGNLEFLASIHGLREVSLANNSALNDAVLARLPKVPTLKGLVLDGSDIRGTTLASLSNQPALTDLSLGCPTLGDLFVKNLSELKQVKRLSLAGSGITDAGLQHLASLKNLESLDLRRTKTSSAGVAELRKALPKCRID